MSFVHHLELTWTTIRNIVVQQIFSVSLVYRKDKIRDKCETGIFVNGI